jgi:hypothetical protein
MKGIIKERTVKEKVSKTSGSDIRRKVTTVEAQLLLLREELISLLNFLKSL